MKIVLTKKESQDIFYNALCNGLGEIRHYGKWLDYSGGRYLDAYELLNKKGTSACHEDILIQMLKSGCQIHIGDYEELDLRHTITMATVYERVCKTPIENLLNIIKEEDDAWDADAVLQTVFFNEIIYG